MKKYSLEEENSRLRKVLEMFFINELDCWYMKQQILQELGDDYIDMLPSSWQLDTRPL